MNAQNALAETIIGLFKAELIHRLGPWKSANAIEWEIFKWVDWFNNRRLLGPIGKIPPAETDAFRAVGVAGKKISESHLSNY